MHITSLANFEAQQKQSGDPADPTELAQDGAFAAFINDFLIAPVTENSDTAAQEDFSVGVSTGINSEKLDRDEVVSVPIVQLENFDPTLAPSEETSTTHGTAPNVQIGNFGNTPTYALNTQEIDLPQEFLQTTEKLPTEESVNPELISSVETVPDETNINPDLSKNLRGFQLAEPTNPESISAPDETNINPDLSKNLRGFQLAEPINSESISAPDESNINPVLSKSPRGFQLAENDSSTNIIPPVLPENPLNPDTSQLVKTNLSNPKDVQIPTNENTILAVNNPKVVPDTLDSNSKVKTPEAIQNIIRGEAKTFTGTDADIAHELGFRNISEQEKVLGINKNLKHFATNLGSGLTISKPKKLPDLIRSVSKTIHESEALDVSDLHSLELEADPLEENTTGFDEIQIEESSLLSKLKSDLARKEAKFGVQKAAPKPNAVSKTAEISIPQVDAQIHRFDTDQKTAKITVKPDAMADQLKTPLLELTSLADKNGKPKTMRFKLNPEELGHIEIRLEKTSSGKLDIHFATEHDTAREILAGSFEHLRHAIKNAGWQVEQLGISSGSLSSNDFENGQNQNNQNTPVRSTLTEKGELGNILENEETSAKTDPNRLVSLRA